MIPPSGRISERLSLVLGLRIGLPHPIDRWAIRGRSGRVHPALYAWLPLQRGKHAAWRLEARRTRSTPIVTTLDVTITPSDPHWRRRHCEALQCGDFVSVSFPASTSEAGLLVAPWPPRFPRPSCVGVSIYSDRSWGSRSTWAVTLGPNLGPGCRGSGRRVTLRCLYQCRVILSEASS